MTPLPPHGGQPRLTAGAPLATARAAMILIHGRGAWAEGIIGLADAFGRDDVHYVAPNALGGTWYPTSFMSPLALNEPGISSGISVVHGLIDELVSKRGSTFSAYVVLSKDKKKAEFEFPPR